VATVPPRRAHPVGHIVGLHRRGRVTSRGNLLVIEARSRRVLGRLVAVAGAGLLAALASAWVSIHNEATEQGHDDIVAGCHDLLALVRHPRYDIGPVGNGGIGIAAMIIAELLSTVALIALLIGWAERRTASRRSSTSTQSASHRRAGRRR
jgi:predicted acyltransferase